MTEQHINIAARADTPETNLYIKILTQNDEKLGGRDVIIMIPGGPGNDHSMYQAAPYSIADVFLEKADVVLFDPRGCGNSDSSDPRFCHLQHYIADIESLRVALNLNPEQTIIFGQSYGAIAATAYASTYPNHLKKLLLIGGAVDFHFMDQMKQKMQPIASEKQKYYVNQLLTGTTSSSLADVADFIKTMMPLYSYTYRENNDEMIEIPYNVAILNEGWKQSLPQLDLKPTLQNIICPTLILYGSQDHCFSLDQIEQLHQGINNATLKTYDECGHLLWIDQWNRFVSDATTFLSA